MLEKVVAILEVAKQPVLKCHIATKCDLSSLTFSRYMTFLLQNGLLDAYPALDLHMPGRKTRRRMIYQISQEGLEFLKRYNALLSLMEIPLKYAPKIKILTEKDQGMEKAKVLLGVR